MLCMRAQVCAAFWGRPDRCDIPPRTFFAKRLLKNKKQRCGRVGSEKSLATDRLNTLVAVIMIERHSSLCSS